MNQDLVEYFIQHTDKRFDEIKLAIEKFQIEIKIEQSKQDEEIKLLNQFKWTIWGGTAAVVLLVEMAMAYLGK